MTTEGVANFVVHTIYEQLPKEAIWNAKRAILDNIGVTLAGSREPSAKIIKEYVKELRGEPSASVVSGDFKTSIPHAALANGTLAHAVEYDDYDLSKALHPLVSVWTQRPGTIPFAARELSHSLKSGSLSSMKSGWMPEERNAANGQGLRHPPQGAGGG